MPFPMMPEKGKFKSDAYKTYKQRNDNRIDLAQKMLEKHLQNKNYWFQRFGWDEKDKRIPYVIWNEFPDFIKSMPDTVIIHPQFGFCFIESKGCREYLGIKEVDISQYVEWNKIAPLFLSIFSTIKEALYIVPLALPISLIEDGKAEKDKYHDNDKVYFKNPLKYLENYEQRRKQ